MHTYKRIKYIPVIFKVFLIALMAISVSSCNGNGGMEDPDLPKPFRVSAHMSATSISRADMEGETVVNGIYTLAYLNTSNSYGLANVNFGVEGTTPGIGIVSIPSNDGNTELNWNKIGGGSFPAFYLDNVPLSRSDDSDPMTVTFTDDYNPFVAGIFDEEKGSNDLLWGTKNENRNVNTLNFDLHHNMARLQVIVTVDKSNSAYEETLNLEGANVSISNLILEPESYNRADGTLFLGENPGYKELVLVSKEESGPQWVFQLEDPTDANKTNYTTGDFVLPPQSLQEDRNRPRLTISLANGKVFSGVIPYAMTVVDATYPEPGYPMALSFLKEHILTIRTLVSEEPPELVFMPVYVVEWVDKGEFFLDGHQAGIYSGAEFYKMIEYYNSDENTRNYQLQRYGTLYNEIWNFVLWNTITLGYGEIYRKMSGNPGFSFSFSGYGVYVTKEGVSRSVTENQLYQIVTGDLEWNSI